MKAIKLVSKIAALSYIVLGLLTIGSIINGTTGLFINLTIGVLFIIIGFYLYARAKNIVILITETEDLNKEKNRIINALARFLIFERIFIVISLSFGIFLLSGAISRVFRENMPIFG